MGPAFFRGAPAPTYCSKAARATVQKAARLLREDRVTLLEGVKVYHVVGDDDHL